MASAAGDGAARFTLLDDGRAWTGAARWDGAALWLAPQALHAALGWELKPQGVCRGEVCIPATPEGGLLKDGQIGVHALAAALERPLAVDAETRSAYLGASAGERGRRLASLEAPDFELPDVSGTLHRLSDLRGRKVLLAAYASW
jgi:hypothetical protein